MFHTDREWTAAATSRIGLEADRRAGAPGYAPSRHVLALSALLAERAAAGLS